MTAATTFSREELEDLTFRALFASKTSDENARSVARALAQAEIDGQKGHGIARVPTYAAQARAGKVDGRATPTVSAPRPATLLVDACHGFAFPAVDLSIDRLTSVARAQGIATAAITRSHHFGVAGHHVERLAREGLVGLCVSNTPKAIAPWGGKRPVFGTNPIAFSAPSGQRDPIVIDLALSQVARGKILNAAQKGEPIPEGWAFDEDGNATTDAQRALSGTLLPIGGAKGAALALMVEVMAAALTGALLSTEASSLFDDKGPPPGLGQLIIAIDPAGLGGTDVFAARIASVCSTIADEPGVRLPGSRRLDARARAEKDGVSVDPAMLAEIRQIASGGVQ